MERGDVTSAPVNTFSFPCMLMPLDLIIRYLSLSIFIEKKFFSVFRHFSENSFFSFSKIVLTKI